MSDYYTLTGPSIFTILSVGEFVRFSHYRANADADADAMRDALKSLGMQEYREIYGNSRRITKQSAINHMTDIAKSRQLSN